MFFCVISSLLIFTSDEFTSIVVNLILIFFNLNISPYSINVWISRKNLIYILKSRKWVRMFFKSRDNSNNILKSGKGAGMILKSQKSSRMILKSRELILRGREIF